MVLWFASLFGPFLFGRKRRSETGERQAFLLTVGPGRVGHTSLLHADVSPLNLADEHRTTEADLKASGLAYTILRNGWYTENYTASIPPALAHTERMLSVLRRAEAGFYSRLVGNGDDGLPSPLQVRQPGEEPSIDNSAMRPARAAWPKLRP